MFGRNIKSYLLILSIGSMACFATNALAEPVPADFQPGVGTLAPGGADPMFDFSYTSNDGLVTASGVLDAVSNGNGTYTATSGTGIEISSVSGYTGPIALIANPGPPAAVGSPSGFFIYDDQLLPGQNPLITNPGLLFAPLVPAPFTEINIFSNGAGPGTYQYYENNGFNDLGNFTLTAVPLPATAGVGFGMLGIFGGLAALRKRLMRTRRIA